ncbi:MULTISPECIES: glycosyltransferase family 2 protein [unclassified Flavobacterium]|uniref:glycosyltransferase family 2 protein n=1 Tax=unclassified Flavobacterium TaxID=196869 RepID=UPI0036129472
MIDFSVSVIMPVYNAAAFVEKAVRSALALEAVKEIVIVEDGSLDNSLQIIRKLQNEDDRIKIYQHLNNSNKGRSASRNLALLKATQPYISFLDADDFYLNNRFTVDELQFKSQPNIDGVYNAIGVCFYRKSNADEQSELEMTTVTESIEPNELFECLLHGKKGYFSIDGLTIKKDVLQQIGYFETHLVVAEDTDWLLKMAMGCVLVSGEIKVPVAMRGVHETNVFNQDSVYKQHRDAMYRSVIGWGLKQNQPKRNIDLLLNFLFYYRNKEKYTLRTEMKYWFNLIIKNPKLVGSSLWIKYCPIIRQRRKLFPFLFR